MASTTITPLKKGMPNRTPKKTAKTGVQSTQKATSTASSAPQAKTATMDEATKAFEDLSSGLAQLSMMLSPLPLQKTSKVPIIIKGLNARGTDCFAKRSDIDEFLLHMACNQEQVIDRMCEPQDNPSTKKETKNHNTSSAVSVSSDNPHSTPTFDDLSSKALWDMSKKVPILLTEADKLCVQSQQASLAANQTPLSFGNSTERAVVERKFEIAATLDSALDDLKEIRKTHTTLASATPTAFMATAGSKGRTLGGDDKESITSSLPSAEDRADFALHHEVLATKLNSLFQTFSPNISYQLKNPNIPSPSNHERNYTLFPTNISARNPEKIPLLQEEGGEHVFVSKPETIVDKGITALTALRTGLPNHQAPKLLITEHRLKQLAPFTQAVKDTNVYDFVQQNPDGMPKLSRKSTSSESNKAKLDNQNDGKMSGPSVNTF